MSRQVHIITPFQSHYTPGVKVFGASDRESQRQSEPPYTFLRCSDINVSLAVGFTLSANDSPSSSSSAAISFGLSYCPSSFNPIGLAANSWGVVIQGQESVVAANGERLCVLQPIRIASSMQMQDGDELRIDVNFRRCTAHMYVNNILVHSFSLIVMVPAESNVLSAIPEDFFVGFSVSGGITATIFDDRLRINDRQSRLSQAMLMKDRLVQERKAGSKAKGIPSRGKVQFPSQQQRRVEGQIKETYKLEQSMVDKLLHLSDRAAVNKVKLDPLHIAKDFSRSWNSKTTSPIAASLSSKKLQFYIPGLEKATYPVEELSEIVSSARRNFVNGSTLEEDCFPSLINLSNGPEKLSPGLVDTSYLRTLLLYQKQCLPQKDEKGNPLSDVAKLERPSKSASRERQKVAQNMSGSTRGVDDTAPVSVKKQDETKLVRDIKPRPTSAPTKVTPLSVQQASVSVQVSVSALRPPTRQHVAPSSSSKKSVSQVITVSSSLYKPPVACVALTPSRPAVLPKTPLRLFAYDTLRAYSLLVSVERCDCCSSHFTLLSHDESAYQRAATAALAFIREYILDEAKKLQNRIDTNPMQYLAGAVAYDVNCTHFGISSEPYCYELKAQSPQHRPSSPNRNESDGHDNIVKRSRAPANVNAAAEKIVAMIIQIACSSSLKTLVRAAAAAFDDSGGVTRKTDLITQRFGAFEIQIAFRHPKLGVLSETLHSKLVSRCWVNDSILQRRLHTFLSKVEKTMKVPVQQTDVGTAAV